MASCHESFQFYTVLQTTSVHPTCTVYNYKGTPQHVSHANRDSTSAVVPFIHWVNSLRSSTKDGRLRIALFKLASEFIDKGASSIMK